MLGNLLKLFLIGTFWLASALAHADKRVALVIGNSAYQSTGALANPVNDADDIAASLRNVGFTVILERNLTKRGMEGAIASFARLAQEADAALFFYAGHGMQYRSHNYLMPVDAKLEDEFNLNFELTRIDDVLFGLERARGVKILILDACRNNPLAERLARTATTRDVLVPGGLAKIEPRRGMVIAYSTQANQVAVDGSGRNSPFASALVRQIEEPGLEIAALFRRVAAEVNRTTRGQQLPELSVTLVREFYLNLRDTDLQAWSKVRAAHDPRQLRDFIEQYPTSVLVEDARQRLATIEREQQLQLVRERQMRDQSERQRLEREHIARTQAEREQAERERQRQEQAERERVANEQARPGAEPAAPVTPTGNVQTAMLPPPSQPTDPPAAPALSGAALVQGIKKELTRVGCYGGRIDEEWPTAEMTTAIKKFATYAKLSAPVTEPTIEFFETIRGRSDRVCPLECGARQVEKDGRCITKTCPSGFELNDDGRCTKQKPTASRPEPKESIDRPNAGTQRETTRATNAESESRDPSDTQRRTTRGGVIGCDIRGCRTVPEHCRGFTAGQFQRPPGC